jgi:signal transduction histidine kinase
LHRVLRGMDFAQSAHLPSSMSTKIVPHEAVTVAQSLKPYARSLSHELRTPMQGVVGMLDVMMANLKEAAETMHMDPRTRQVLDTLKENIEAVQG